MKIYHDQINHHFKLRGEYKILHRLQAIAFSLKLIGNHKLHVKNVSSSSNIPVETMSPPFQGSWTELKILI